MTGSVAIAGPDPATPTPVVPAPPPLIQTAAPTAASPQAVQAAQALFVSITANPPQTINVVLQARIVSVLNQIALQPSLAAELGLSAAQINEMIVQIQAIPTALD